MIHAALVSATDGVTPSGNQSVTAQILKPGASDFADIAGSVAESSVSGTYIVSLALEDVDTPGPNLLRLTSADALPALIAFDVVRWDPVFGLR